MNIKQTLFWKNYGYFMIISVINSYNKKIRQWPLVFDKFFSMTKKILSNSLSCIPKTTI